jgi:hypothetical protein
MESGEGMELAVYWYNFKTKKHTLMGPDQIPDNLDEYFPQTKIAKVMFEHLVRVGHSKKDALKEVLEAGLSYPPAGPRALIKKVAFNEMAHHDDFNSDCGGFGFKWKCPDCGEEVSWAPLAWWPIGCECRDWEFKIEAVGLLKKDE